MIKPFLAGVTNLEINSFIEAFNKYGIEYCVVGDLLVDESIKNKLINLPSNALKVEITGDTQVLDCTSGESYEINVSREMLEFSSLLEKSGVKAFRKSSCVNSYILNIQNPANYINEDPHGYCIKCGVCKKT